MNARIGKSLILASLLAVGSLAGTSVMAYQTQAPTRVVAPMQIPNALSMSELERRVAGEIPHLREIKVRDRLAKIKGYDAEGRKVKLVVDRVSGEVLQRELKYDKHGPFGGMRSRGY